jgi:predicted dehydrogenase
MRSLKDSSIFFIIGGILMNETPGTGGETRRSFMQRMAATSALALTGMAIEADAAGYRQGGRRIKVGVIGCGSVSWKYIPEMQSRPFIEIVSACDLIVERARARAKDYGIPNVYSNIEDMLAGAEFELLVNLTSMPAHYKVNKRGLEAGRHVWSEKPLANTVAEGRELLDLAGQKNVGFWGAPCTVISPQFRFMAESLAQGRLGRVCAARAIYGHNGWKWLWAPEFFQAGGGCLYDLGVYNIITLTGLLGPAKRVAGFWNIVHPEITVTIHENEKVKVKVETDENAMLMIEHEKGVFSHVMTGFSFFDQAKPHDALGEDRYTIEIIGDAGVMSLAGYDWGPVAVDLATQDNPQTMRYCTDLKGYQWQIGASYVAECLLSGKTPLVTAEQALHAVEIMQACRESCRSGKYIDITTRFKWPLFA